MAANAYILMNVEPAKTQTVLERLRRIPDAFVREVLGPYDIIMQLEADTDEDLTSILRNKVRPISGITNTVTCLWF